MNRLGLYIGHRPRRACALTFGVVTLAVQHFTWVPQARTSGLAPALTITVGVVHAVAGAITAPRLLNGSRTHTASQAGLLGAATSLLALALFAPLYSLYIFASDIRSASLLSSVTMPVLVAGFAFLADGWGLLVVSMGLGWLLFRLAATQATV